MNNQDKKDVLLEMEEDCSRHGEGVSQNQTGDLHIGLAKLLNQILGMVAQPLRHEIEQTILNKNSGVPSGTHAHHPPDGPEGMSAAIQAILRLVLDKLESARSLVAMDTSKGDYDHLEEALQKKEAQVRNHLRLEMQQKLYESELQETIATLQNNLEDAQSKIKHYQQRVQRLEKQNQQLVYKVQRYQQRLYEFNRGSGTNTLDKKSSEKLLHKASLNIKQRVRHEPYLESTSKSKQLIHRPKQPSRYFRDRASRLLCFESVQGKRLSAENGLSKKSMSHQTSKIMGHCSSNLSESIRADDSCKRRKAKARKELTEADEAKEKRSKSIYI